MLLNLYLNLNILGKSDIFIFFNFSNKFLFSYLYPNTEFK